MNMHTGLTPATTVLPGRQKAERHRALDDQRNSEMTRLLREAAEIREGRERARSAEDALLARREAAAFLDVIRSHARARETGQGGRRASRRRPRQA